MPKVPTFEEQRRQRSGPIWRWVAAFMIFLNLVYLGISLFATWRPDLWAGSDPFSSFSVLTIAIILPQFTPFVRSLWIDNNSVYFDEIDEYERSVTHKVIGRAYRTVGAAMFMVLFALMLGNQFAGLQLNTTSAGYWLMWFALMFFSLPVIFASLETGRAVSDDVDE
jgi:hypothetical protein